MALARGYRAARFVFIALLLTSLAAGAAAEEAAPEPTAEPVPAAEAPPLNCKPAELIDRADSWSVDCVALWLENLGFADLKAPFMAASIDGAALGGLTSQKLADDFGMSDEDERKKIIYALKDVARKDSYTGNMNHLTQMLMWLLPVLAVYKYLEMRYEKQIQRITKKYRKWQEARNPPKPVEPVVLADGTNEWLAGLNKDVGTGTGKEKKTPKDRKKTRKAD